MNEHTYIHTCIQTYIWTNIHTYIRTHIHKGTVAFGYLRATPHTRHMRRASLMCMSYTYAYMCIWCHTRIWCICIYVGYDACTCVIWLICLCDITRSYVWHDSFICVTWLIHMCDMAHSYVLHDSFIRMTWLVSMSYTTQSYVWQNFKFCRWFTFYIKLVVDHLRFVTHMTSTFCRWSTYPTRYII